MLRGDTLKTKVLGIIVFGSALLIAGGILFADSENIQPKPKPPKEAITLADNPSKHVEKKTMDEILDSFQLEKTEFGSLENYMKTNVEELQPNSEYLSYQSKESALYTKANAALHYVNYFENEIAYKGLTDEFKEWQLIAFHVVTERDNEKLEKLMNEFESKLYDLASHF